MHIHPMTDSNDDKTRGRPASGEPREAIERRGAKNYRTKQTTTKANLRAYIDHATTGGLQDLKTQMDVSTVGEVIDRLVKERLASKH